jgi:Na+-transporting NADH:ubiquinone oxidoreductase subunit A
MSDFLFKLGLDLPISGSPEQRVYDGPNPTEVALIAADFNGLKPKMLTNEGSVVERGTPLFCHKDDPNVMYVSPCKGIVKTINRGARRVLESVVIEVKDASDKGIKYLDPNKAASSSVDEIKSSLQTSGLWTSFSTRPYSKVPSATAKPHAIYVTAMESEPLSPDASVVINRKSEVFSLGIQFISKLTTGKIHVCKKYKSALPDLEKIDNVEIHSFAGPHPSGLAGTHMHFIEAPSATKTMWSIGYQDVIAIGELFKTGYLNSDRIISLAGPMAKRPRLVKVLSGIAIREITENEIMIHSAYRVISGSVLTGRNAEASFAYLGRYARQITIIEEDTKKIPFGWIRPQPNKYSAMPVLASAFLKSKFFNLTSNLNGGRRAMVPTGVFETLMPQDVLPTQLLRSLLLLDTDTAQNLGALELDEEDVALCTFECPAKYEYGQALRESLQKIEKEG